MNPFRWIYRLLQSRSERKYEELCRARPMLSDAEFVGQFYASSNIPAEIPIRARRVVARELAVEKVFPQDNLAIIFDDLDLADIVEAVADDFGIEFNWDELQGMDGTFDNIVQEVARKLASRPPVPPTS